MSVPIDQIHKKCINYGYQLSKLEINKIMKDIDFRIATCTKFPVEYYFPSFRTYVKHPNYQSILDLLTSNGYRAILQFYVIRDKYDVQSIQPKLIIYTKETHVVD